MARGERVADGAYGMAAGRERGVVPGDRVELFDLLLGKEAGVGLDAGLGRAARARREHLPDREQPDGQHHERDAELDERDPALVERRSGWVWIAHLGLLLVQDQPGELDADGVAVSAAI